jgi:hypothetical protein
MVGPAEAASFYLIDGRRRCGSAPHDIDQWHISYHRFNWYGRILRGMQGMACAIAWTDTNLEASE